MKKPTEILFAIVVIALIGVVVFFSHKNALAPTVPATDNSLPTYTKLGILGNKDDLISFSIWPNSKVHGVLSYRGVIKGGYFFEANILINILDANKNVLK